MKKVILFLLIVLFSNLVFAADYYVIPFELGAAGSGTSQWTNTMSYSGSQSVYLKAPLIIAYPPSNEGRIHIEFPSELTLGDINSISWMQYVVQGYATHVDVLIDTNGDDISDDALVFEYDKVDSPSDQLVADMDYVRLVWINTFDDKGIVDDSAIGWLNSGDPGPVGGATFYAHTLAEWKAGQTENSKTINTSTKVIALEIEVDGWILESEAYVDDIEINGIIYYGNIQDAIDSANDGDTINVGAGIYNFVDLISGWDGYGFLRINKPLILKGDGSSNTIIDGQHIYSVLNPAPNNAHCTMLWIGSSNVNLEGLTIKGCDWGIRVSDAHSGATEISDLKFKDVTATDNYGHGIVFENYHVVSFKRVEFTDCNANANGDRGIYINPTSNAEDFTLTNTNANDNLKAGFNCQGTLDGLIINGGTFNNNTGGWNYEHSGNPYFGAGIELDGVSNAEINGIEANMNGLLGPNDCGDAAWNTPPFSMTGGAGILLKDDTSNIEILNSELKDNANGLMIEWCKWWPTGSEPADVSINYNSIENNVNFGVLNRGQFQIVNATYNWWGSCDGPSGIGHGTGDAVYGNVNYDPWLGVCITNKTNVTCAYEASDATLQADLTGIQVEDVWFSYTINGINYNKTASYVSSNKYQITIPSDELIGGMNVTWNVYANDSLGYSYNNSWKEFYVREKTSLIVEPIDPDGLNGWYITEPNFTLENPDAANKWYRWDGTGTHPYTSPFNLTNIPNPGSAGTLKLTWWGDVCSNITGKNETEQNKTFYIDLTDPKIKNLTPANNSIIYNNFRPTIQAYLDEVYQSNSGINKNKIVLKLNGAVVSKQLIDSGDLNVIVKHTPITDLFVGWHNVSVNVTDKAGRNSELTWFFYVNITPIFNMTVYSPENASYSLAYGSRRVQFNVTATETVSQIKYINWNDKKPRWAILCRNCWEYGYRREKTKNLNDGWNNITIRAEDKLGNIKEENRTLFIDSKEPVISNIGPARNAVINGSEFKVKYTEDNLNQVTLTYGNIHGYSSIILNCSSGRNQECLTTADLSSYNGQWIDFWFNVSDFVRNVESRKTRVEVDTKVPELTINHPINTTDTTYGRRVRLDINVSEKVILEYYDYAELRPRWRTLCARCSSYNRTKAFARGPHEVAVRARDEADNSDSETRNFEVDY